MNRAHARRPWLGLGALATLAASAALIVALQTPAGFADNASEHANPLTTFPGASWPATGGDLANSRYSTLTQITRGNVKNLVRAWSTPNQSRLPDRRGREPADRVRRDLVCIVESRRPRRT